MAATEQVAERPKRMWISWHRRRELEGYLFVLPWILGLLAFFLYPILFAIYISFTRYQLAGGSIFIGLDNYRMMFREDPLIAQSLKVTAIYTITSVPLSLIVGFAMAYLLNQPIRGVAIFRTIYYVPAVLSGPAVAVLWGWLFNTQFGLVNQILDMLGVPNPYIPWTSSREWVLPFFVVISLWTVGHSVILYLAGLQGIPTEMYEAADVDGANRLTKLIFITLPMMTPVIFFNLVTGIINSFQTFTTAFVLTEGGPANASLFYYLYIYRMAFKYARLGYAAAMAWLLFIILGVVTFTIMKTSGAWVFYEFEGGES